MLDDYGKQINEVMVSIYDSVQRVEQGMLNNTKLNLSISEMNILEIIGKSREEGCSVSHIARGLKLTLPTITVAVKKLEEKGYVEKVRSAQDARRLSIVLTHRGKKADAVHRYFHEQAVHACLRGIEPQGRTAVLAAMRNLNDFLQKTYSEKVQK
ncbi:MAG: MarR family transcriptional regulator [Eubacteriales bacterium]|nr:MarR family transcriptional regulator [Eubacteriales bacterium]